MNVDDLELELRKLPGVRAAGFTERDDVLLIQLQVSGETPPSNLPLQATRIAYRHSDKPVALEVVRWRVAPAPRYLVASTSTAPGGALEMMAGVETAPGETENTAPVPDWSDVVEPGNGAGEAPGTAPPPPPLEPEVVQPAATRADEDARGRVRLLAVLTFPDTDELEVHLTFEGRRVIGRAVASNGILAVVEAMVDGLKMFAPQLEFAPSWARVLNDERGHDVHLVACELTAPDGGRRLGVASGASAIEAAARSTLHALNRSIAKHLNKDVESA